MVNVVGYGPGDGDGNILHASLQRWSALTTPIATDSAPICYK
jgi:hypothetical protein